MMNTPTSHSRNLLRNSLCIEILPNPTTIITTPSSTFQSIHHHSSSSNSVLLTCPSHLMNHDVALGHQQHVRMSSPLSITSSTNARARYSVVTCGVSGQLPNVTTDWDIKKIQEEIRMETMMNKNTHTPSSSSTDVLISSYLNTVPSNINSPTDIPILDIKKTENESEAESFHKIITSSRNRSRTFESTTPSISLNNNTIEKKDSSVDLAAIPNMSNSTSNGQVVENIALSPFTKIDQPVANSILKFCTIYEFSALCRVTQQWNYFTKIYLKDFADSENLKTCLSLLYCKLSQCLTDVVEFEDRPLKKVFQQLHQHRHLITNLPKIASTPSSNTFPLKYKQNVTDSSSSSSNNSQQQPLLPLHELFYESYISYFGTIVPRLAWHISRKNVKKRITFNEIQFHLTVEMFLRGDDDKIIPIDTYEIEQYIQKTFNSSFAAQLMTSVFAYFTVFYMRFDELNLISMNTVIASSSVSSSPMLRKHSSSSKQSSSSTSNKKKKMSSSEQALMVVVDHDDENNDDENSLKNSPSLSSGQQQSSKKRKEKKNGDDHLILTSPPPPPPHESHQILSCSLGHVARKTFSSGILPTSRRRDEQSPSLKNLFSISHDEKQQQPPNDYLLSPQSPKMMMRNNSSSMNSINSMNSNNRRGSLREMSSPMHAGVGLKFDRGEFLISQQPQQPQGGYSMSREDSQVMSTVTTEDEVDVEDGGATMTTVSATTFDTFLHSSRRRSSVVSSSNLPTMVKYLEIVPKASCELGYMFLLDFFKIISRYCKKTSFNFSNVSEAEKARIHYLSTLSISPYSDSASAFMPNIDEGQVSRKNTLKFKGVCHAMADSEFITCLVMSGKEWNSEDVCLLFNSFNLLEGRSRRDHYCVDLVLPNHIELMEGNHSKMMLPNDEPFDSTHDVTLSLPNMNLVDATSLMSDSSQPHRLSNSGGESVLQHAPSASLHQEESDTRMVKWPSFLKTVYMTEMNESLIFHDRWCGEGPKIREIHLNLGMADSSLLTFGTLNYCKKTLRHFYISDCTLNYKIGSNFVNVIKELDLETLSLERFHLDSENWRILFEDYLQNFSNSLRTIRLIDCINQLSDVSSFVHNIQIRSIQLEKVELKLKHFGEEEKGAVSGLLEHLLLNGNAKTIIADSMSSLSKLNSTLSRKKKKGCIIS
ncbi:hypothetical protein FDP41_012367 [Naegleria fowleri]|uniref:F-box domain-containing protein n=1 Tax=Naegleria fowleri TaxID=5763 RepID=A0A6A5C7G2_NAEFO|nr:uncharacterized protein FDP41_012367 [Naegleria fowleri]KAF0981710.1 hypothetical protein FDP41_012367 [Naegleria fowleri]